MPCYRDTERCDYDQYSPEHLADCCHYHLIETIHYVGDLLKNAGITHWLHYGTLLGSVRALEVIPWDSDGDIACFSSDREKVLRLMKKVHKDGFYFNYYHDELFQVMYSETNQIYCDIWFFDKVGAQRHSTPAQKYALAFPQDGPYNHNRPIMRNKLEWMQVNHTTDFPYWFVSELWETELNGKMMPCPRYPKKFVELIYGPKWKKPRSKSTISGNYYPLSHWFDFADKH